MATSQNGWSAATSYTHNLPLESLRWITGTVRAGDVHTVFDYLGERFNEEVEPINKKASWGFAPRLVRGNPTDLSNHASGTAVDFNAPKHPLGKAGTFTLGQQQAIHHILSTLDGVVRWGGDYNDRKDEMHFEVVAGPDAVKRVAEKIKSRKSAVAQPVIPKRKDDDMLVIRNGSRFRLITGGKVVGISQEVYEKLDARGVVAISVTADEFDKIVEALR